MKLRTETSPAPVCCARLQVLSEIRIVITLHYDDNLLYFMWSILTVARFKDIRLNHMHMHSD